MKLLFTGDIMPGGVLPYCNRFIDNYLLSMMGNYDLKISTLECALGENNGQFDPIKMNDKTKQNIVFIRKEDLLRLKIMNINVVSLANNHAMDCGVEGLDAMIKTLSELGIKYVGAGKNLEEAKRPVIIETGDKTISIIAFQLKDVQKPWCYYPSGDKSSGIFYTSMKDLLLYIKELKKLYDFLILMPHWGEEHQYLPSNLFKEYARRMLEAGADCIIGSHPHIINPVVSFSGKKCYFSLGNFLFPEKCMQVPRPMYYPETKEEYLSLKRFWTYPKSITEPIVAVWKPKNRIGMMVEVDVENGLNSKYHLTCLTADNVLHRYSSKLVRIRMAFWAMLMHMPKYGFVRKVYNHRYNIVRRLVDRLPAFNIPVQYAEEYRS